ncbi:galactose oxidase-like protein precursor [Phaeosphaeria sp. MPI-PUGE-AT-0046c]|nr:galactose oxidase-like protein precursor [Phaeosphaeria sp. MPI-PUGE-AT-0046c]
MHSFNTFGLLAAVTLLQTAHSLNICPGTDSVFTGAQGIRYRICPDTDLVGRSTSVYQDVASTTACAKRCDESMNCFKAVYDTQTRACHFKGITNLKWVDNGRFDVIQAEQIDIASCPYDETTEKAGGKTFKVCKDTDLRGKTAQAIKNVPNLNECAQRCSGIATCVQAVFDSALNVCHIKADAKTDALIWSTDKRFDVIRLEVAASSAKLGAWSDVIPLPVIPVAAYVVPEYPSSQRLLVFSSWAADAFGGAGGKTQFADYNYKTGDVSARTIANTHHDMFCPAISSLEDGRILVQGGSDASATSFYDPATNEFKRGPDMKMARGYQTSVTTSDNRIFTIGGAYSGPRMGKDGEIYDPKTNTWKALPGAKVAPMLTVDGEGIWREDNHAWLFSWKNGSVFQAGPSKAMNWYGTAGTGSQVAAGIRDPISASMCGIFVMYEPGKILSAGGSPSYTNSDANARAHITTIDKPNAKPTVERVPDMAYPRGFSNAVVLPDGTVLVTGGQRRSKVFTDDEGILYPELFNPATKTWRILAPEAVPRNYHSVSILLADGRVFSGGGGLCYTGLGRSSVNCNKLVDHADGQIFSPPYLFNADGSEAKRPTIAYLGATSVKVGGRLAVNMEGSAKDLKYSLVRIGSVTHSVNSDQRRIPLTNVSVSNARATVTLPDDSGVLIPGSYYLFAMNAQGVPSIGQTVKVTL